MIKKINNRPNKPSEIAQKVLFALELVGATGRPRTDAFDTKNGKIQLKWKIYFPKVEEPGPNLMKAWNRFKSGQLIMIITLHVILNK